MPHERVSLFPGRSTGNSASIPSLGGPDCCHQLLSAAPVWGHTWHLASRGTCVSRGTPGTWPHGAPEPSPTLDSDSYACGFRLFQVEDVPRSRAVWHSQGSPSHLLVSEIIVPYLSRYVLDGREDVVESLSREERWEHLGRPTGEHDMPPSLPGPAPRNPPAPLTNPPAPDAASPPLPAQP